MLATISLDTDSLEIKPTHRSKNFPPIWNFPKKTRRIELPRERKAFCLKRKGNKNIAAEARVVVEYTQKKLQLQ